MRLNLERGSYEWQERLIAAQVLCATPRTASLEEIAERWKAAASICPGLLSGDVIVNDWRKSMHKARDMIDALITEDECFSGQN